MSAMIIEHHPDRHRFEAILDGAVAGYIDYQRTGDVYDLQHTIVEKEFEGRGVGSALARGTFDEIRAQGAAAIPTCPFLASWIGKHPEYADLVAS